jgi:D-alanine-D-alanine ligase
MVTSACSTAFPLRRRHSSPNMHAMTHARRPTVLVLWNQVEEDVYEHWRAQGQRPLPWDPGRSVPDVGTVAEEMDRILAAVRAAAARVDVVNVEDDLERLLAAVRLYRPDVVMNLVEYFQDDAGLEAAVAGLFDLLGVAYTGNPPLVLSLCQDKHRTKLLLDAAGLPTAPHFLVEREPVPADHGLDFPLIVKPVLEDASGGIEAASVVHDQAALEARVRHVLTEYEMSALIEEYIDGREIHAAILGNDSPEVLPLFEMEFDDSEFNPDDEWRPQIISFGAKWDPHSPDFYSMDSVCPAQDIEPEVEAYIRDIAVRAYQVIGCRDYARIDMRLDEEEGEVYILEVNPNPDLADGAAYMQCAVASGRTFEQTIAAIIDMAWQRARALTDDEGEAEDAELPSDRLLRAWVVQQRGPGATPSAVPCEAVPCEAVPCEAVPCEAVPCEAVPCEAVPGEAVPGAVRSDAPGGGTSKAEPGGATARDAAGGCTSQGEHAARSSVASMQPASSVAATAALVPERDPAPADREAADAADTSPSPRGRA